MKKTLPRETIKTSRTTKKRLFPKKRTSRNPEKIVSQLAALFKKWKEEDKKNPPTEEDIRAYDEAMKDHLLTFRD